MLISKFIFLPLNQLLTNQLYIMKKRAKTLFTALACFFVCFSALQAQQDILEKLNDLAIVDQKVMMPMRDGIR